MAARENQGLQAALIIFVLITIGLFVSTYIYFRSAEEADKVRLAAESKANDFQKQYQNRDIEVRCLKYMLGWDSTLSEADYQGLLNGVPETAEIREIDTGFKQDMAMYGKGLDKPNYRLVPAELLKVIKAKNEELITSIDEQKKLQAQLVAAREESKREVEKAKQGQEEASAELVKRTQDFQTERDRLNGEKTKLAGEKDGIRTKLNESVDKAEKDDKAAQNLITKLNNTIMDQKDELKKWKEDENFEVADGKITYVNQRQNLVLVNIGSADGLREQISFSVYDQAENSATRAQKKAGIEIIRVVEPHLAEARIVHSQTTNPILPGDLIYSPVWSPGQRMHFALTSFMDINGDGVNDRDLIRTLIQLNGGIVDVEQGDDGAVTVAKMTLQTRYLVEGDLPTVSDKGQQDAHIQGRNSLILRAGELGVERVAPAKLLGWMGWKGEEKTTSLGRGASTEAATKGGKSGGAKEEFRKREPPAAKGKDSAF